jgi:hypothetical protein
MVLMCTRIYVSTLRYWNFEHSIYILITRAQVHLILFHCTRTNFNYPWNPLRYIGVKPVGCHNCYASIGQPHFRFRFISIDQGWKTQSY